MSIGVKKTKASRLCRALLAMGTATGALCLANPVLAACVIAPGGTGTVANPGPNSIVICTGTTNGINVAGTNSGSAVQIEGGAEVNGVAGSEIALNGSGSHVIVGGGATTGPATLRDTSLSIFGDGARLSIVDGSVVDQSGNTAALIFVNGAGASIDIGTGSQVTVSRAVQLHGDGATMSLEAGATLSASADFAASALIFGGTGTQIFNLEGRIETRGDNAIDVILDASDGDDIISLNDTTRFAPGAFASLTPTFLLDGGNGVDQLYLDNIDASLNFDTRRIERLIVDPATGGGVSRIRGTHEFQSIRVANGQLDIFGDAALGAAGSVVDLQGSSRIRFFSTGAQVLTQRFNGSGTFEYHGGSHQFASANGLSGTFILVGGTPLITHSNAFGTATVVNFGEAILRDVNITNNLTGNGNFIIDGSRTFLGGANTINGTIFVRTGDLLVNNLAALGNGSVLNPSAISIAAAGRLILDISGSGTLGNALSDSGTLEKQLAGDLTINRSNPNFSGQVNLLGGRTLINADNALGTGTIFLNSTTLTPGSITLANTLTGTGTIEKNSNGVTSLLGNNSQLSGLIAVNTGTIRVVSAAGLGTANVTLANAGLLQLDVASSISTVANVVSGSGIVRKTGAGQVNLNGANSYTGGTNIDAGTLRVATPAAIGTGAISVAAGATLVFENAANATLTNVVGGAGTFRKLGSGQLDLTAMNSLTGSTNIDAGTLRLSGAASLGTGAISVATGATLLFENSSNVTFANSLSGAGSMRKLGSGQLSFANPLSIGTLTAEAGRVRINSTVTTNATVASGATLDGNGRIIGNLTNNGTVAPGNSIGTLTVQGNYVHGANSVLEIEFDGAGGIDLLSVTGTATLNGGTLRFSSLNGAEGSGGTFLTAAGGVTGTFANIQTVGAQLPLAVIYQTNSAIMAPSVLTARPSTFNAQFLAAADTSFGFIDSVSSAASRATDGTNLWLQGFGASGKRSASGTTLGYDHNSYGLGGGLTVPVGENAAVGAAIGWARGDIDLASNGGGGDQDSVLASLYAHYNGSDFSISAGALFGKIDQGTLRNVSFNGFSASVSGATESELFGGYVDAAVPLASADGWSLDGQVRASILHQSQNAYVESGTSPLRLAVADQNINTIEGQAGVSARRKLGSVDLRFDVGARYLAIQGDRIIPVTFAASNAVIALQGDTRDDLHGYASAVVDYAVSDKVKLSFGYAGQVGVTDRHEARVGIIIGF